VRDFFHQPQTQPGRPPHTKCKEEHQRVKYLLEGPIECHSTPPPFNLLFDKFLISIQIVENTIDHSHLCLVCRATPTAPTIEQEQDQPHTSNNRSMVLLLNHDRYPTHRLYSPLVEKLQLIQDASFLIGDSDLLVAEFCTIPDIDVIVFHLLLLVI